MRVFVLDRNKKPLDPCPTGTAWKLLKRGRAAVFKMFPLTIILKDRTVEDSVVHEHRVKIDPGSKVTGIAVVQQESGEVVFGVEAEHRGQAVRKALDARRAARRSRRQRKTRYRQPRFDNRTRPMGWLPPSLESRIGNVLSWVRRLIRLCPVAALSQELVKFDTQALENPEISGIAYQQGTLLNYEIREYLLEKWYRKCAYCGTTGVPLQVEHICPRSQGGGSRPCDLTLACEPCNQRKGNRSIEEFLKHKPDVLARILAQSRAPLKDAAVVNATRWELWRRLTALGLPVECGSGGRTKFNRAQQGYPKAHWIDAACVGVSGESVRLDASQAALTIKAMGQGKRQLCRTDRFGFPVRWCPRSKKVQGVQTGDLVCAEVPSGKYAGRHVGRVAVRSSGSFQIGRVVAQVRHVWLIQRVDGYQYTTQRRDSSHP